MWKRLTLCALALGLLLAPKASLAAPLHKDLMASWKQQSSLVEGREFKFLADPAKLPPDMKAAFKEIWDKAAAVAKSKGIEASLKEKNPFKLDPTLKTFFDTPDRKLWKAGWLIRVTTSFKKGYAESIVRVMVKRINAPAKTILANKMSASADVEKPKVSIEDNIGINADGTLYSYLEQGLSFRINRAELGEMNLADFGKFVPGLLKIGLPADTKLDATPAFGIRCKPGYLNLAGLDAPVGVSMEAWARSDGAKPFVYDFSFGYEGEFDKMDATHTQAQDYTIAIYKELNKQIGFENTAQYGGSKVRVLLQELRK